MKKLTFWALLISCLNLQSFADSTYPVSLPATPAEVELFNYLKRVANIKFQDGLQVEPWIQCDDFELKRTFFSASLLQFSDDDSLEVKLQSWLTGFLDHAFWANVKNANCTYDINHFNECFSRGRMQVSFNDRHISYFHEFRSQKYCKKDH